MVGNASPTETGSETAGTRPHARLQIAGVGVRVRGTMNVGTSKGETVHFTPIGSWLPSG